MKFILILVKFRHSEGINETIRQPRRDSLQCRHQHWHLAVVLNCRIDSQSDFSQKGESTKHPFCCHSAVECASASRPLHNFFWAFWNFVLDNSPLLSNQDGHHSAAANHKQQINQTKCKQLNALSLATGKSNSFAIPFGFDVNRVVATVYASQDSHHRRMHRPCAD